MLQEAFAKMPEAFDAKHLLSGQEYFLKGQVLNIRFSEGLLRGRVKGSSSQIYDVHMDLKKWPQHAANCTCAYPNNCKHAAACLFALRARDTSTTPLQETQRLDRKLDLWLKNLRAQEAQYIPEKPQITHHITYLLTLKREGHEHKVGIRLALAKLLKRGGYGKKIVFHSLADSKKQHFIDDDEDIVAQLIFKCDVFGWFDQLTIRNSELLTRILATERAFLVSQDNEPIHLGEQLVGRCQWKLLANGDQRLLLMHEQSVVTPLLLDDCWYFDHETLTLGPLHTDYPMKILHSLLDAPPIPMDQVELFSKKMAMIYPEVPGPLLFKQRQRVDIQPVPVIVFDALHAPDLERDWFDKEQEAIPALLIAQISFDYDGLLVVAEEPGNIVRRQQGELLLEYQRDLWFEACCVEELQRCIALRAADAMERHRWQPIPAHALVLDKIVTYAQLDTLYIQVIPHLKSMGWRVELASFLYQEVLHADELQWFSDAHEQGTDFFSYQLGILIDGRAVSVVPLVADLLQRYSGSALDALPDEQQVSLPLEKGRVLQLAIGRIKPLIRLLLQLGTRAIDAQSHLQVSQYQLVLMQEAERALAATRARWQGADIIRQQLTQLIKVTELAPINAPTGLNAHLREYQLQGLSWLQSLRSSHFNGILADDMGLGKTVQTLAHLLYEKEHGRMTTATLIVAPTSLVGNWRVEAQRFTPDLKVLVYHGSSRHQDDFDDYDLVISTYGLIHRDKEKFTKYHFYYLILDEAQFIKNARTKTTQMIQQLQAQHRLCLSGTPLENHLGELWSLFHFLMPGLLGDAKQFRLWFRTPIEKYADNERRMLLTRRVQPFMLRRTKNQVAHELPPKTEIVRTIELLGPQRDLYEAIRMSMEQKVRDAIAKQGLGKSHLLILDALLKLRQVCCDPRLLSVTQAEMAHDSSAKLDVLLELLDNLMEEGRRVLIFSQFTSMLHLIEQQLLSKEYRYLKLTGQTQNRQALVERFQEGTVPIFLISLKAGGTGLNLTKADTVIHYDPWWNPAVEDQATDRTHRIGQNNPVFVYKLISSGTVEEAILGMQERKRQLVSGILSADATQTMSLTEADLDQFFMPLTGE